MRADYLAASDAYFTAYKGWILGALGYAVGTQTPGAAPVGTLRQATEHEDMHLGADYVYTNPPAPDVRFAFRGREASRCRDHGREVRQLTLRQAGTIGFREYDKVYAGMGRFYVVVWAGAERQLEAGVLVDLEALRGIAPHLREEMEYPSRSNVPFVGYDVADLIAHDAVPVAYPSPLYFAQYGLPRQGGLL